jgi:5-oxoprolinase (ATP-hydrolysing)
MNCSENNHERPWQVAIDTGGTFTDAVARSPEGHQTHVKVLSDASIRARITADLGENTYRLDFHGLSIPEGLLGTFSARVLSLNTEVRVIDNHDDIIHLEAPLNSSIGSVIEFKAPFDAPRLTLHLLLGTGREDMFPEIDLRVATTRGTNALLEGKGDPFALILNDGMKDLLEIGDQTRADLFALENHREFLAASQCLETTSRLDHEGRIVSRADPLELDRIARSLIESKAQVCGISLIHGYLDPVFEKNLADELSKRGVQDVICATDLSTSHGLGARTETVAVEATLRKIMNGFVKDLLPESIQARRVSVMTSSGGLTSEETFQAKDGLLSGPAGGVVGASLAALNSGESRILGFDMGGTSTDVSRWDRRMLYRFETKVGPARIQSPCLAIETVAAGGGSICKFGAEGLSVGPESAGASPGPACYGAGGPLTVTDVNLLSGRVSADRFGIPVDINASELALKALVDDMVASGRSRPDRDGLLRGLLEIANERMSEAMQSISLREGADPSDHALVPFGGAGGQHACAIADRLGIKRILFPVGAGLLSAHGVLDAPEQRFVQHEIERPLDVALKTLKQVIETLIKTAMSRLPQGTVQVETRRIVALRLMGQDDVIQIDHEFDLDLHETFHEEFSRIYGYPPPDREIEVAWIRVVVTEQRHQVATSPVLHPEMCGNENQATLEMLTSDGWSQSRLHHRSQLSPGTKIKGPAIIDDTGATFVVEPEWELNVLEDKAILLVRSTPSEPSMDVTGVVASELVCARIGDIAVGMGRLLERTALSVNVKQRLDFSCAVLDTKGRLLVNAPHMPIHLGSMGLCVRETISRLKPGPRDVLITNHPACGGSHLPDVTVIAPVHDDSGTSLGYVAVRAHHAEIGGSRPGSTPPFASSLEEEGVIIPPMLLVNDDVECFDDIQHVLEDARFPTRKCAENIADLRAQLASIRHGSRRLNELARSIGTDAFIRLSDSVRTRAAESAQRAIRKLGVLDRSVEQRLDDGTTIQLRLTSNGEKLRLDFSGTSPRHPANFNAPIAITLGATVYLMRLLADEQLPMNEGLLDPVELHVPESFLNPSFTGDAARDPAVCAGNTETSQRVTDTLLLAFQLAACSQGTMNNLLFGDETFGYYETIAGGSGATRHAHGTNAVHTHMTNTRITDPETLESRYPVSLARFEIRRGSGGTGLNHGGAGVIRSIRARKSLEFSFIGQHRKERPYGLEGGGAGSVGIQYISRTDGSRVELSGSEEFTLGPGDMITIETPGGGAWGALEND